MIHRPYPAIAIDDDGNVFISYMKSLIDDQSTVTVELAWLPTGAVIWEFAEQPVATIHWDGEPYPTTHPSAIAIRHTDGSSLGMRVGIAYRDQQLLRTRYAFIDDLNEWQHQDVAADCDDGNAFPALLVQQIEDGIINRWHATCSRKSGLNYELVYNWRDEDGLPQAPESIASGGQDYLRGALALGSDGGVHLVYHDATDHELYYRQMLPDGDWLDKVFVASTGVAADVRLLGKIALPPWVVV